MAEFFLIKTKEGYQLTHDPHCEETEWVHTISLLPRKCEITGESLLFKPAYHFRRRITGYDCHEIESYWHSEHGHTLYLLQKEI